MRTFHHTVNRTWCPSINVDHLWTLLPKGTLEQAAAKKGTAPVLDVTKKVLFRCFASGSLKLALPTQQGYFKVLGKGSLPKQVRRS
jgi:large subunit ribosomal protein L27Ae